MRNSICVLLFVSLVAAASAAQNPAPTTIPNGLPEWAYNIPDKVQPPEPKVPALVRVSGSAKEYEASAIAGNANPPDWFPDEHPAPPTSVKGPMPNACGSCHLMSGQGHPESADIAGMPAEYILRQMNDFKSGARKEEARMGPIARAVSDADLRQAAEYFAAVKPNVFVKVIETATPPKTYVSADARHRRLAPDGGTEPIGRRIIQIPDDTPADDDPQPAFRLRRIRAALQHRARQGAGASWRIGKNDPVRDLSR